jgi:hypothetical protein
LKAEVFRETKDQPRIADGTLNLDARFRAGSAAEAEVTASLRNIRYYRGFGDANLDFAIQSATYNLVTPGAVAGSGGLLGDVHVELKSIDIPLTLKQPIVMTNLPVKIDHNSWVIADINSSFEIVTGFRNVELIYARAKSSIGPQCVSKLKFQAASYTISGDLELKLGQQKSISISGLKLDRGVEFDPDLGSCNDVVDAVCFVAGSALLGPLGGVAAGILCDREIDKHVGRFTDGLRALTVEKVQGLSFSASL